MFRQQPEPCEKARRKPAASQPNLKEFDEKGLLVPQPSIEHNEIFRGFRPQNAYRSKS